jgi:hypothetical protein
MQNFVDIDIFDQKLFLNRKGVSGVGVKRQLPGAVSIMD